MAVFFFPETKCVFIHNPKTGGASIRHGFFGSNYEGPAHGHVPEEWLGYFKFCFVRNPFDRLISAWKMFTSGMENTKWKYPQDANRELDLPSFLQIVMDDSISYDGHKVSCEQKIRHHTLPQSHPFNCVTEADFVGRFENLAADFDAICQRLGIEGQLPHWNKTRRTATYQQFFDNTTRQLATEFYAEDLRLFEYEFDEPSSFKKSA